MILQKPVSAATIALVMIGAGSSMGVAAQTVSGPLAQADTLDATMKKGPAKKAHPLKTIAQTKGKVAEKAKPPTLEPWAAVDPGRVAPTPPPETPAPASDSRAATADDGKPSSHPDLAMKWNGNNDTATQTRVQNYGGEAEGAGAAMGLKFHF